MKRSTWITSAEGRGLPDWNGERTGPYGHLVPEKIPSGGARCLGSAYWFAAFAKRVRLHSFNASARRPPLAGPGSVAEQRAEVARVPRIS